MAEVIRVTMTRPDLDAIPAHAFSGGYGCRLFRPGDEAAWAEIESAAGEFASEGAAREHFAREFGPFEDDLMHRCLLLEAPDGRAVGTTTAWYGDTLPGGPQGRLHWVAIHPEHQGRRLARPLVCAALRILAQHHDRAYLTSQTSSARAIGIYLDLGFEPYLDTPRADEAWRMLAESTHHPALHPFLL